MRFNLAGVKCFVACGLVLSVGGCLSDPASRFEAQFELGFKVIRDGLEIEVEPGADPRVDPGRGTVWLHASSPTPTITIDHGGTEWSRIDLEVDNVFLNGTFVPVFSPLDAAEFVGCGEDQAPGEFILAPLVPDPERRPERVFEGIRLAPCSRTVIRMLPPGTLGRQGFEPIRMAVIGETRANYEVLSRFAEHVGSPPTVNLVVALGNVANSGEWVDLERWREEMAGLEVPVVTVMGQDEVQAGALLPFHEVFGRADFHFRVGDVEFFVMDTASGGLAEGQLEYWEEVLGAAQGNVRLVFMHTPPFDPSGTRDRGFTSRHQAARLIQLLGSARVDAVFTGGSGTYRLLYYGGIPFYSTGGGGGPLELGDDWGHHFLRVRVRAGDEEPVQVELETL